MQLWGWHMHDNFAAMINGQLHALCPFNLSSSNLATAQTHAPCAYLHYVSTATLHGMQQSQSSLFSLWLVHSLHVHYIYLRSVIRHMFLLLYFCALLLLFLQSLMLLLTVLLLLSSITNHQGCCCILPPSGIQWK